MWNDVVLFGVLLVATVKDIRTQHVKDHVWLLAAVAAPWHIEVSIASILVMAISYVLYRMNIFGGADAKAVCAITIYSNAGISVLFYTFFFCCLVSIVYAFSSAITRERVTMSFPLIPVIWAIFTWITIQI